MGPERIALESSLANTGLEVPEEPRLSYGEMRRTTDDVCTATDGSFEQGGIIAL